MTYMLTLPEIGETVTEGTIERWLKQPGDEVKKYEPIVEINTDKVDVELPCPVSGTLKEIVAQEGETVEIGGTLAIIDEVAGETPADISPPKGEESEPTAPTHAGSRGSKGRAAGRRRATPRVTKLAEELGVDLETVTGTGPGGRIVEDDVRGVAEGAPAGKPAAAADETVQLTGVRRTIAQRMSESAFSAPTAWLAMEADVTPLVALRRERREAFREKHGVDLTYLPFMAHAVSQALKEHPYLNASWGDDKILLKKRVNLGIAVATERGLLVPVVPDADRMGIAELAKAITGLGEQARDNKLTLEDVQGGTFTLDNTGAFGSIISKPIINLGQAAIITLEAVTKQPRVVGDDAIAVRSVVTICLSFDHRVLDGHQAGAFLNDVKERLESIGSDTALG
jgi:2-oxoisovalerate dehydrogenase E2 component (dihydrolipoyl transacylase)